MIKIIVRGILQKLLRYWTIRRRDDRPSNPATQRIILKIDGCHMRLQWKLCPSLEGHLPKKRKENFLLNKAGFY